MALTIRDIETNPHIDQPRIEDAVREILIAVGEDPDREGLRRTPQRVARMYAELFAGLHQDPVDVLEAAFSEEYDELVVLRDISFSSLCEHHLMPFEGVVHIAYLPDGQVVGIAAAPPEQAKVFGSFKRLAHIGHVGFRHCGSCLLGISVGDGLTNEIRNGGTARTEAAFGSKRRVGNFMESISPGSKYLAIYVSFESGFALFCAISWPPAWPEITLFGQSSRKLSNGYDTIDSFRWRLFPVDLP